MTWALKALSDAPTEVTEDVICTIEEFVLAVYDLDGSDIDAARLEDFFYKVGIRESIVLDQWCL